MKKIRTLLVVCFMALALTLGLTSCGDKDCEHSYDNACDAVCNECGEERTVTHNYSSADCVAPKTCTVCGAVEGEALGHTWSASDCDSAKTCTVCGAVEGEALGHTWSAADCDSEKTCSVCGATEGEALGHTWSAADCDSAKTCTVCGATEGEALGHTWSAADCDSARTCDTCGLADGEPLGHTPNEDDGDCTTAVTCGICGTVTTEAKAAHEAGEDDGDCTTDITCKNCDKVAVSGNTSHSPNEDDGNCLTAITCSICGTVTTEARADHEAGEDDGDCTTEVTCKHCTAVVTAAKTAHEVGEDDGDCSTAVTCKYCEQEVTPAKSHDFNGEPESDPEGHYRVCANEGCEAKEQHTPHTYNVTYIWSGDHAACRAMAICSSCEYEGGEDANVTESEDKITATFSDSAFETQTVNVIKLNQVNINSAFPIGWDNDDEGKTAWAEGDRIIFSFTSARYGTKNIEMTRIGGEWQTKNGNSSALSYVEGEATEITAFYAPYFTVDPESNEIVPNGDYKQGMYEYLTAECGLESGVINIDFSNASHSYSRLCIAMGEADKVVYITVTNFIPAGATVAGNYVYEAIQTKDNGNFYLFGTFCVDSKVTVYEYDGGETGEALLEHTFEEASEAGKSYALNAETGYEYDEATNTYTVWKANGLYAWLHAVSIDKTTNLVLTDDIYLPCVDRETGHTITVTDGVPSGSNWVDVYAEIPFSGTVEGNGYSIVGIRMVSEYIGFISWIEEPAEIKNLNLEDAVMYSSSMLSGQGLFVGIMNGGSVINCTTDAACSIKSAEDIGGIVGNNDGGIVSGCTNYADVIGDIAGGVVGCNIGTVSNCKNYGDITGRQIGGVVGNDEFGEIFDCTNYGKVIYEAYGAIVHQDCAGGVIGYCHGTENYSGIENKGEVTSNGNCEYIGNLIGYVATTESPLN